MLEKIVITKPKEYNHLLNDFKKQGKNKIHVLADFDKTLTKAMVKAQKMPSIIAILRDGNYLTSQYAQKAHQLFAQYHPIEIDPQIPLPEKKFKMAEWWQKHFKLLLDSGLNIKDIEQVIKDPRIQLRQGAVEFFKSLAVNNIPLLILSAAGLGVESIFRILERNNCLFNNMHIISNEFEYDNAGNAVKVKEPIIHALNKDETIIAKYPPVYNKIKNRTNVILLGDNLADVGMIDGFVYDNLIKIGFLNYEVENNLTDYKNSYDVVIINDKGMNYVNDLLKQII
jgi:5'-nucleotidase